MLNIKIEYCEIEFDDDTIEKINLPLGELPIKLSELNNIRSKIKNDYVTGNKTPVNVFFRYITA